MVNDCSFDFFKFLMGIRKQNIFQVVDCHLVLSAVSRAQTTSLEFKCVHILLDTHVVSKLTIQFSEPQITWSMLTRTSK